MLPTASVVRPSCRSRGPLDAWLAWTRARRPCRLCARGRRRVGSCVHVRSCEPPIAVDASAANRRGAIGPMPHGFALWIMGIVDHAVNDGCEVLADRDDEATRRQLAVEEMDSAALADRHCRRPEEAQRPHVVLEPLARRMDTVASRGPARLPLAPSATGQRGVDLDVGAPASDRHRTHYAVSGAAPASSITPSTVVVDKPHGLHLHTLLYQTALGYSTARCSRAA